MRLLSPTFIRAMNSQESDEVILPLVKLSNPAWQDSVRLVHDYNPITHNGEEYTPFAFSIYLPDDDAEGIPVLKWTVDNVNRELVTLLRSVRDKINARVIWVLASDPDYIEVGPFDVEMTAVEYDAQTLSGTMQIEPILDEPFGHLIMTPKTTPGIF